MMSISNIQTSDYENLLLQVCLCRDSKPFAPIWASYERIISLNVAIVYSGKHAMKASIEIIAVRGPVLVNVLRYQDAYGCNTLEF